MGWVMLNTDGASTRNPGLASGGGLLRDYKCEMIKGFIEKIRSLYVPKS